MNTDMPVHFIQTSDLTYLPLLQQTSRTVLEYCRRHAFSYENYVGIMRGSFPWHSTYNRILMLDRIKKSGYRGWVFYVDADAFVVDLKFDLSEFLRDKSNYAFIAALGGAEGVWFDVNAGVLLVNLGHPVGADIVDDWLARFLAITDNDLSRAEHWYSVTDDQTLLGQTLESVNGAKETTLVLREPHLINYDGSFVRQILRAAGTLDERIEKVRLAVEQVFEADRSVSELQGTSKEGGVRDFDPRIKAYLAMADCPKLEIGSGANPKPGWLSTDLNPVRPEVVSLDATKEFGMPSDAFDYIYSEHMIEHIDYSLGVDMLRECFRVMKPGGVIRIVTPSLGFLLRVISPDRGYLEEKYIKYSVETSCKFADRPTNAFFVNNFMRAWGHTFIYDRETLALALEEAGFRGATLCGFNESAHLELSNLEHLDRMPPGFLELESMVMEATKPTSPSGNSVMEFMNLSVGKTADQSSISRWSKGRTTKEDASRVVSGVFAVDYNCHTEKEQGAWWRVDLERQCYVYIVKLFNREIEDSSIRNRLTNFEIQVSSDDINWTSVYVKNDARTVSSKRQAPFVWRSESGVTGRYVRIRLLGDEYLNMNQVEIYGRPAAENE